MLQRLVSLLLVPAFAAQTLGFSHSHVGTNWFEATGHKHAPHVHFAWPFVHHDEDHDVDDHHGHDGSDDGHEEEGRDEQAPAHDHDSDAVYQYVSTVVSGREHTSAERLTGGTAFVVANGMLCIADWLSTLPRPQAHPPPLLRIEGCPIYLRTLSLLL